MAYDIPCLSYITLYIISLHIINTNQRTSTHWKLNPDEGKVQATVADGSISDDFFMTGSIGDDVLMNILTNKIIDENGDWKLDGENVCNDNCKNTASKNEEGGYDKMNIGIIGSSDNESKLDEKVKQKPIDSKAKQNSTKSKIRYVSNVTYVNVCDLMCCIYFLFQNIFLAVFLSSAWL